MGCMTLGMISLVACGVHCWMWPSQCHSMCNHNVIWIWRMVVKGTRCGGGDLVTPSRVFSTYVKWPGSTINRMMRKLRLSPASSSNSFLVKICEAQKSKEHRPPPTSAPLQLSCLSEFRAWPYPLHQEGYFYFNITVFNASLLEKCTDEKSWLLFYYLLMIASLAEVHLFFIGRGRRGGLPWILFKLAASFNDGRSYCSVGNQNIDCCL